MYGSCVLPSFEFSIFGLWVSFASQSTAQHQVALIAAYAGDIGLAVLLSLQIILSPPSCLLAGAPKHSSDIHMAPDGTGARQWPMHDSVLSSLSSSCGAVSAMHGFSSLPDSCIQQLWLQCHSLLLAKQSSIRRA